MTDSLPSADGVVNPDGRDDQVDVQLAQYVNLDNPTSFLLFAGAGSGKTRSLVKVLGTLRTNHRKQLLIRGQRIGVITYTNAACDEIKQRLDFDALIEVSTIHSFAWNVIRHYQSDIREWLRSRLVGDIAELREQQETERPGTKAARERVRKIELKSLRLERLDVIKRFVYSPTGSNSGKDALSHDEVIAATASLLTTKLVLQQILVSGFPVLLIDECQDTIADLMDAFLVVQHQHATHFCLGLFGDMMQRIYGHGRAGLEGLIPKEWACPAKAMNHRSAHRIIRLVNRIRADVDQWKQVGRSDSPEGVARLFVLPSNVTDKREAERKIAQRMAQITGDVGWDTAAQNYKTLILEHHMAAHRLGFAELFETIYAVDALRTGLLDGDLPELRIFSKQVLPLVTAHRNGERFRAAAVVRQHSPLLRPDELLAMEEPKSTGLHRAKAAVDSVLSLWDLGIEPTFAQVLRAVADTRLFEIPESLETILRSRKGDDSDSNDESSEGERGDERLAAWHSVMQLPFRQIVAYEDYVTGESSFGTHQGVKGLEFPRVMVIADDAEARGFLFSYEKLLGAKDPTGADRKSEQVGKDTSHGRTRRLFYVTCSRAIRSLVIVAYSDAPERVREFAIGKQWFDADEVEMWDATLDPIERSSRKGS